MSKKSLLLELFGMRSGALPGAINANMLSIVRSQQQAEEEQEQKVLLGPSVKPRIQGGFKPTFGRGEFGTKYDQAVRLFPTLYKQGMSRFEIINSFEHMLDLERSTSISYYERISKYLGLSAEEKERLKELDTNPEARAAQKKERSGEEKPGGSKAGESPLSPVDIPSSVDMEQGQQAVNPEQGVVRHVDRAHLVFKRQNKEGTFDELWVYNVTEKLQDELQIKQAILAGTDIPNGRTQSKDGNQRMSLTTLGNAQMLHITGLPS